MFRSDRKLALLFLLRFALVFAALLLPIPWLADAYTSAFDSAANCVLYPINELSNVDMRFEPPESIGLQGSWKGKLRILDKRSDQVAHANLNVRTFSYRPLATYLALALAMQLTGRRRNAVIIGGGVLLMLAFGMLFSALPILARFTVGGALGIGPGLAVMTLYDAIATPVMVYAVPLITFCALTLPRLSDARNTGTLIAQQHSTL
jgi:hypothetical protein